jgi:hypothetical protein
VNKSSLVSGLPILLTFVPSLRPQTAYVVVPESELRGLSRLKGRLKSLPGKLFSTRSAQGGEGARGVNGPASIGTGGVVAAGPEDRLEEEAMRKMLAKVEAELEKDKRESNGKFSALTSVKVFQLFHGISASQLGNYRHCRLCIYFASRNN